MTPFRKLATAIVATAVVATSTTPAFARPGRGWGGHGYHHHHRGSNVGGALIGGLVVGGLVAAIASSSERSRPSRNERYYQLQQGNASEDRIADTCAAAVEEDRGGRVNEISDVGRFADGWRVQGVVDPGTTDAAGYRSLDSFSCTVVAGRVDDIRYGSEYSARR